MEPPPESEGEAMKLDDAYFRGIYNQWLESEGDTAEELIRQVARDTAARCVELVETNMGLDISTLIETEFQR